MGVPPSICVRCKGYRRLCGLPECPLLIKQRAYSSLLEKMIDTKTVDGATPPSFVLGEKGYPRVSFLLNIAPSDRGEEARIYEDPKGWWGKRSLWEIVSLRSSLFAAKLRVDARDPWSLYTKEYGLASISMRPVSVEAEPLSRPRPYLFFDPVLKPVGISSPVRRLVVSDEPKIHRMVEKLIWDDAPAYVLVGEAYKSGMDVYEIVKLFSLGFLGRIRSRRMVPTRWSITAVDDIVSRFLRKSIIDKPWLDTALLFRAEYLYNVFDILLLPGSYEALYAEVWYPRALWNRWGEEPFISVVREDWRGRTKPRDGGFSASRLPVLEYLDSIQRQARVFILRQVFPEYVVPVGNWHIRETVRRALSKGPVLKGEPVHTIEHLLSRINNRGVRLSVERVLSVALSQKRLEDYIEV